MKYILKSILTSDLSKKEIFEICLLKNSHWKFGIRNQIKWFKENVKKKDIHNCLYLNFKLIGYTSLKRRTFYTGRNKSKYLLFDTLIINKKYRKKKLSSLLMNFNNEIIKQNNMFSFLICKNKLVKFYLNCRWKKLKNKNIIVHDHSFTTNGMVYNLDKFNKKNFLFFIHK